MSNIDKEQNNHREEVECCGNCCYIDGDYYTLITYCKITKEGASYEDKPCNNYKRSMR